MSDSTAPSLSDVLQATPGLWRGRDVRTDRESVRATGFACLDAVLPGGGWPAAGVIEVVVEASQPPPLHPFLPTMVDCARAGQRVVLVDVPAGVVPFTPAWQQAGIDLKQLLMVQPDDRSNAWWVIETALRSAACGLVLAWPCAQGGRLGLATVRRWQLAAAAGRSLCILFVPARANGQAPNVHLRLQVQGACVQVLKARGSHQRPVVQL